MADFEALVTPLPIPPRSYAMAQLWRSIMSAEAEPPSGTQGPHHFPAIQLEALWRAGRLADVAHVVARKEQSGPLDPLTIVFKSRLALAQKDQATVCATNETLSKTLSSLPQPLIGERVLTSGYCAAVDGNAAGAGLVATLARDKGIEAPTALAALDAIASGQPAKVDLPKVLQLLDYRLLEASGTEPVSAWLAVAQPALLVALATSEHTNPALKLEAAEQAARLHLIDGTALAAAYRVARAETTPAGLRAERFRALEQAATTDGARALLLEARKSGALLQAADAVAALNLDQEPVEAALVSLSPERARRAAQPPQMAPWRALVELLHGGRGAVEPQLGPLEALLQQGRLSQKFLQHLTIVLDAFDVNVSLPLWEAANRAPPSPKGAAVQGYLPPPGVLQRLEEASKKREAGRTALLALTAMGPGAPDAVNSLVITETLKALRRAGLEAEARLLALELLLPLWPA